MKVSVLIMTYNHERFIAQALDSALTQETSFDYEILVSEDCSTDRTREIVVAYHARYPDRIRLLLSEANVRSNEVVARGFRAARGRYLALLDGDDYWTSPYKLQKQADFLDRHPECALCFHNALVADEDGAQTPRPWTPAGQKPLSTIDDLWRGNFIATCSVMYRLGLVDPIPDWYEAYFPITDWPLHLLHAEHGPIGYIDEVMGVYRHHSGGLYSPLSEAQKLEKTAQFYAAINADLGYRYNRAIRAAYFRYFYEWAEAYEQRGDLANAWACLRRCLAGRPANLRAGFRQAGRMGLRLLARRLAPGKSTASATRPGR